MSTQKQKLEQCSADVQACREDVRTSTAQLNSKVIALQEGLSAVLRILGQQAPHQNTAAAASQGPCKRARAESSLAAATLDNSEIFSSVFSYVGYGEYFYVAAVCRKWRGAYISLCHRLAKATEKHKLRTKCRAIVVTAARLQLAITNGAEVAQLFPSTREWPYSGKLGDAVVRWSLEPIAVLTLLRVYGYAWEESLYDCAAAHDRLELMQWLHQVKCPLPPLDNLVYDCAYNSPTAVSILQWLHSLQPEWFDKLDDYGKVVNKTVLLDIAGDYGNLTVMQWLRCELKAKWPPGADVIHNDSGCTLVPAWRIEAVIWALDHGLEYKFECSELDPEKQTISVHKEDAIVLQQWVHKESNRHRCTCNSAQ
jgi:hypothetical protein